MGEKNVNYQSQSNEFNSHEIELNSLRDMNYYLSDITSTNSTSLEQTKEYIKYPMIYNKILRAISKQSYSANGIYGNTVDYCVAIPTLDSFTVCRNKNKQNKKHKQKFNLLLKLINHKRTTRDILRHLFIDGMYVGILRDTVPLNKNIDTINIDMLDMIEGLSLDDNFMIQPLNLDYCKIVGFQNNVSIAAFDMQYFDQFKYGGLIHEIKNFPPEFIKAYNNYKRDSSKRWFILDYKKTIALKARADEDESYGRPYGLSALAKIQLDDEYENSQYNLINELASSIYFLILPESEKKGQCSLNKQQQENVIKAFESAVKINTSANGSKTKISTLSLAPGTQIDRLSKDASLLKDTLSNENMKKISTALGFASSALNASSEGGASYSNLAVNLDLVMSQVFQYIEEISNEITRILNDYIGNKPKDYIEVKYLRTSILNSDKMYDRAKELYTHGSGSLKVWIASAGFDPDDYLNLMEEEIDEGIFKKFTPHLLSYNISASDQKDNDGGRPQKDEKDLTESGQKTKNKGDNNNPKPSTK
jgi:hypothetical protein